ncbi:NYN domain-containing protein [Bradyrhizobium sp. RDT46]|uniref:NYN domain-containing protein n=1 Tax=Bradyrhizobium sp. RDT46 TaxID=3341829 RepID=UPI0035C767E6
MALFGSSYNGPREVHYLFIDGGAMRGRIQNLSNRYFGGVTVDIDFAKVGRNYTKVFYYDALPVREDGETEQDYELRSKPMRDVLDSAANVDGVHVYEGDARRRRRRGLEQKKVDVMLTVDMLTHSFRKNMHKATLLTGDNDFKPLIDALVQDGMFVSLMYPPEETSRELMQAADARFPMSMSIIEGYLTADSKLLFDLPKRKMHHQPVDTGNNVSTWTQDNQQLGLHELDGEFLVTQVQNPNNTLHVSHKNLDLLRHFCKES